MKMYQSHLYPADAVMCDLSKLQVYPKDEKDRPPLPPRRGALVDSDAVRDALNDLGSTFSLTSISADVDNYSVFALSGEEFDVVTKQQYTSTLVHSTSCPHLHRDTALHIISSPQICEKYKNWMLKWFSSLYSTLKPTPAFQEPG